MLSQRNEKHMEAPHGFRAVSITQALMEFAKPLMKDAGDSHQALNEVFGIVNAIWNFEATLQGRAFDNLEERKGDILNSMQALFKMNDDEAKELFQRMIERKQFLFPKDVRSQNPLVMFMRKDVSHLIAPFHYGNISFLSAPIPSDEHDQAAIEKIKRMDKYIIDGAEYDEWESFYFSMEKDVADRFEKWLHEKGATEQSGAFASNLELFLNFIYLYSHDDPVILRSVPPAYFEEFLFDYLLRKLIAEPHEYVTFPPTLKFFYRFLNEKGYMADPESVIQVIDALEPEFMDILRERFG